MKTHCKRGHAMTPDNVRIRVQHGKYTQRNCRMCEVILQRRRDRGTDRTEPYTPIDEILAAPSIRILRVIRRFDWLGFVELCDLLEIDDQDRASRWRVQGMLAFLVAQGHLDTDKTFHTVAYRLTASGADKLRSTLVKYDRCLDAISLTDEELREAA